MSALAPDAARAPVYTAVVVALLAAALWCGASPRRNAPIVGVVMSSVATALALFAFGTHVSGTELGLRSVLDAGSASETMSPQGSVAVLLVCGALLVTRRWALVAQGLAVGAIAIAGAVVISIAVGTRTFIGMEGVPAMSLPVALSVGRDRVGHDRAAHGCRDRPPRRRVDRAVVGWRVEASSSPSWGP